MLPTQELIKKVSKALIAKLPVALKFVFAVSFSLNYLRYLKYTYFDDVYILQ